MQVGPVEGRLLGLLVRLAGARRVLEVGTFTGYSALAMAAALPDEGRLLTCDVDAEVTAAARGFFDRSGHGHKIEIRLGPALETLPGLAGGSFDLVFLDADKESYPAYLEHAVRLLRPGGLLVADNVLWSGRVLDPRDAATLAIARFNRLVHEDARLEAVMLTVRDGMTLARKR
jgi:caffeoyl-CoA O-methyltransferase